MVVDIWACFTSFCTVSWIFFMISCAARHDARILAFVHLLGVTSSARSVSLGLCESGGASSRFGRPRRPHMDARRGSNFSINSI